MRSFFLHCLLLAFSASCFAQSGTELPPEDVVIKRTLEASGLAESLEKLPAQLVEVTKIQATVSGALNIQEIDALVDDLTLSIKPHQFTWAVFNAFRDQYDEATYKEAASVFSSRVYQNYLARQRLKNANPDDYTLFVKSFSLNLIPPDRFELYKYIIINSGEGDQQLQMQYNTIKSVMTLVSTDCNGKSKEREIVEKLQTKTPAMKKSISENLFLTTAYIYKDAPITDLKAILSILDNNSVIKVTKIARESIKFELNSYFNRVIKRSKTRIAKLGGDKSCKK